MKYSGIGGQAVIEGVMMKNRNEYAVAVRRSDHTIDIKKKECKSIREKYRILDFPVIRGVVAFVESLVTGMHTISYSASLFEEEELEAEKKEKSKEKNEKKENIIMGLIVVAAIIFAIGIFILAPFFISEALRHKIRSAQLRGLLEGVIRVILFLIYVKLISLMNDIKRVFMYHGAEHKSINCVENGYELTVENVRKQSMVHKRCGTSFLLVVMFVSILFFMFIVVGNVWLRMLLRILLIPVIAGVAYEFIRFAGNHDNVVVNILSKPGLWLQSLTTKEPTDDMLEVAIASINSVFDWRKFIVEMDKRPDSPQNVTELSDKIAEDATKVSDGMSVEKQEKVPGEKTAKKPAEKTAKKPGEKNVKKPVKEDNEEIEIVNIETNDEDDDEILNALDRYFEAPVPKDDDK